MLLNRKSMNHLLYFLTIFMLVIQFFISTFYLPTWSIGLFDAVVVLFLLYLLPNFTRGPYIATMPIQMILIVLLLLSSVIGLIISHESILTYINGLRLYGKYFIVFLLGTFILTQKNILKLLNLFEKIMILQIVLCSIQYFVFGYRGDYCGGIFGTLKTNSWTNVLMCIVTAYSIAFYAHSNMSHRSLLINCGACVYVAALTEIKFFYFEFIIILLLVIMFTKPNRKTITVSIVGIILLLALSQLVDQLWSSSSSNVFSWEGLQYHFSDKAYGYSSVGDLGRLGGIAKVNKLFFPDSLNLFGMGIGSTDYGTPFFLIHSYLHYMWFGYLSIYLEMGWVGLVLYITFFGTIIFHSVRSRGKSENSEDAVNSSIHIISKCMAVIGIILLWYNTTVVNYPGYFLFLTLSFTFSIRNDQNKLGVYQEKISMIQK